MRAILVTEPVFVPMALYLYWFHGANSFKSLSNVAAKETEQVLCAYFAAVQAGHCENLLAPDPAAWPGVFDLMMSNFGFWNFWEKAKLG